MMDEWLRPYGKHAWNKLQFISNTDVMIIEIEIGILSENRIELKS